MNKRSEVAAMLDRVDYIDMHIHMDPNFRFDIAEGVLYFVNSMDEDNYEDIRKLAATSEFLVPCFGIHPQRAVDAKIDNSRLEKLVMKNDFVGEIGIDYHWIEDQTTYERQRDVFETQLDMVAKYNKIPVIHTKGAEGEILSLLEKRSMANVIIHWYSGPEDLIGRYLEAGCYFTIGPDIFSGSKVYSMVPEERLFAETDNPTGMPWIVGGQPSGNDIREMYLKLAEKLAIPEGRLIDLIKRNLLKLIEV
jgi:TatD DNase family protein